MEVFLGQAKFTGPNTAEVNGQQLTFLKACIATGGRPAVPEIAGINDVTYYSSDNIFNLTTQPKNLLIVGSGPIGAELGQAFQRLGTEVTFMNRSDKFLPREDRDAAKHLKVQLDKDGCKFLFNSSPKQLKLVSAAAANEDNLDQIELQYT